MKIKEGFVLRDVMGQTVVVSTGEATEVFSGMIKLNDTGACIWKGLENGLDKNELVDRVLEEFDVTKERASEGVDNFIAMMEEKGFLE